MAGPGTLWVVGSLNMDIVVAVARHPRPGETVLGSNYATYPGGKGGNQAVAAAKLGCPVVMVGQVGSDGFGQELLTSLHAAGVTTEQVRQVPGPSGVALITVNAAGENTIVVSPGANAHWDPLPALPGGVGMVLLQLEIPLPVVEQVVRQAHSQGIPVLLNPAPVQELPAAVWAGVKFLVVNEHEAAYLAGLPTDTEGQALVAARQLRSRLSADGTVIVTLGERGCVWSSPEREGYRAAYSVPVVDTTAAGDAFCGAFAVGWLETGSLISALEMASAVAALSVTRPGAQPSLPTRLELADFLGDP
ncbi:MAG: ribokinase [Thermostichales cyanobacterium BF4_bins_65]